MKLRRLVFAVSCLGLLLTSCGEPREDLRIVRGALSRTEAAPHVFRYTETVGEETISVDLRVDDSFRSQATVMLDNKPLFEERLVDDAIAVRLLAPDVWNPAAGTPLASILGSGKWVADPAGAPPVLFTQTEERNITDVGIDHVFDAENALQYVRTVTQSAHEVKRFNKDSLDYRPNEDPFADLIKRDDRAGIVRYDAVPPLLPRSENPGARTQLPDSRYFRRLAIYMKDGRIVRILEVVDYEHHPEILKAEQRGKPKYLLKVLSGLRREVGDNPVHQRRMSIRIRGAGKEVDIAIPGDAITANLGSLLEANKLAKLPDPEQLKPKAKP